MSTVKLQCSDDVVVDVDLKVIQCSETIKTMIDELGFDEEDIIPLATIRSPILKMVIEWAVHHMDDAPAMDVGMNGNLRSEDISPWDVDLLINVNQSTLSELMLAANYLDIKGLLDLTCKTVANMIKGKSPEEIRKLFNINNDFQPEEEALIRSENKWANEQSSGGQMKISDGSSILNDLLN